MAFGYDTLDAPGVVTSAAAIRRTAVQLLDGLIKRREKNNVRFSPTVTFAYSIQIRGLHLSCFFAIASVGLS